RNQRRSATAATPPPRERVAPPRRPRAVPATRTTMELRPELHGRPRRRDRSWTPRRGYAFPRRWRGCRSRPTLVAKAPRASRPPAPAPRPIPKSPQSNPWEETRTISRRGATATASSVSGEGDQPVRVDLGPAAPRERQRPFARERAELERANVFRREEMGEGLRERGCVRRRTRDCDQRQRLLTRLAARTR